MAGFVLLPPPAQFLLKVERVWSRCGLLRSLKTNMHAAALFGAAETSSAAFKHSLQGGIDDDDDECGKSGQRSVKWAAYLFSAADVRSICQLQRARRSAEKRL